ncbi:MAG: hypothetical protein Tsb0016_24430 [Sphingomonadales bacterium]
MTQTPDTQERLKTAEARMEWALNHPHVSAWLKQALRAAKDQDPVTLLNELAMLDALLQPRCHALIELSTTTQGPNEPSISRKAG